jgi:hypothetical protein
VDVIELDPDDEFDQVVAKCVAIGSAPGAPEADRALMRLALACKEDVARLDAMRSKRTAETPTWWLRLKRIFRTEDAT